MFYRIKENYREVNFIYILEYYKEKGRRYYRFKREIRLNLKIIL